ncbi:MAG TPA: LCP family protein [Acidimicrobiia bacterium]|nr:LCP family protein [Acidimicrobiia bacterium]
MAPLRAESLRSQWHAFAARFVTALLVVSVITAGGIGYAYWFANDQIVNHTKSVVIDKKVLPDVKPTQPANYLIVGSDSRAFVNDPIAQEHFGDPKYQTGQRSDTIMVAHIDPKAPNKGFLLSIPRDLWVNIPGHGQQRINAAYNFGPTTLIQTIEQNFDVTINHYLEVGFATFAQMVDAIGSVHIFFPTPAFDKYTGLYIKNPGCVALNGLEALEYVRSRHYKYPTASHGGSDPNNWYEEPDSDFGRIRRQQYFIRSLAQEAISKGARNPFTAKALLQKTVPNLVRDSGMGLNDFLSLVRAFRSVDPTAVVMDTLPVTEGHVDGNDVLFIDQAKAAPYLQQLRTFISQTKPAKVPDIAPNDITVQVLNGSGVKGIAGATKTALTGFGFADGGAAGDADRSDYAQTEVRYVPGALGKAQVVASYLGVGKLVALPSASSASAQVLVVLGRDFNIQAVSKPGSHPTVVSSTSSTLPANPGSTPGLTTPTTVAGKPQVGCG